jgi:hypothetical protein
VEEEEWVTEALLYPAGWILTARRRRKSQSAMDMPLEPRMKGGNSAVLPPERKERD